ncbi:antitoxin [Nocardioides sp. L-11A]|uniref:FitA-like ribbon-helix-helix domain-containing protein n=1 Tax=Nocardioides sp. L-11A TaxID=3043848 RepID=UPI00249B58C4|nr:antitoxin [Nocardioides sp. L-11A]
MSTLQVRNVSDDLRRILKERAARRGMSLSDYVREELERTASQPTYDEWRDRVRLRGATAPTTSAADVLRAERER